MSIEKIIGIAQSGIVKSPDKILTIGLGSCVGISLYDKENKIAGLVHIMLPSSYEFKNNENKLKYADTAISILVEELKKKNAYVDKLEAKIVGGAQMFNFKDSRALSDIGQRNIIAVEKKLEELSIPIVSKDIGGNKGRTMIVDAYTGRVTIKVLGKNIKEI